MKLPPPEGFPEWYSNDPDKMWKSGSWEDYTSAADQLDVVESDEGFYSLQKREISASTPCIEDLVSTEFRLYKGCDMEEFVFIYSKITETDLVNFELLLDEAEKVLQLFEDYFTPDGKWAMLQHDSTVENVVARLPSTYNNITQESMFRPLLERLISMAKRLHEKELYRDYTLFLPECDRIKSDTTFKECDTTFKECLEMLKDDPLFVVNKFGDLDSYYLLRGLQLYLNYRMAGGDMTHYNARIEQDYQWERDVMWQARSRFPGELMTPINFLAFQKRCKGYQVQHPVKEIMKFRAYFGLFIEGVPPLRSPEPSLERPKKRVRHC